LLEDDKMSGTRLSAKGARQMVRRRVRSVAQRTDPRRYNEQKQIDIYIIFN